jgi:HAMP domain-containing protein
MLDGDSSRRGGFAISPEPETAMSKKEDRVAYSVSELVDMARALSEGDFDRKFEQAFQGELGQLASYMDDVREMLRSLSDAAGNSSYLIPEAANSVAEIYQHAENGVNSILDVVDHMSADQEEAGALLAAHANGELKNGDVIKLQAITDKTRRGLISLIGYLSFQDVLRQRVEKVQGVIENLEKRTLELMVKFRIKTHGQGIKEGEGEHMLREEMKELSGEIGLDQALVDELLASLK